MEEGDTYFVDESEELDVEMDDYDGMKEELPEEEDLLLSDEEKEEEEKDEEEMILFDEEGEENDEMLEVDEDNVLQLQALPETEVKPIEPPRVVPKPPNSTPNQRRQEYRPVPLENTENQFQRKIEMMKKPVHHINYNSRSLTDFQKYMWMATLNCLRNAMSESGVSSEIVARIMTEAYRISFISASYEMYWIKLAQLMERQENAFSNFSAIELLFDAKCAQMGIDYDHIKVRVFNGIRKGLIDKASVARYEKQMLSSQ